VISVDSWPCCENRSPGFNSFHLLGEQVETPPLTITLEVCQISTVEMAIMHSVRRHPKPMHYHIYAISDTGM